MRKYLLLIVLSACLLINQGCVILGLGALGAAAGSLVYTVKGDDEKAEALEELSDDLIEIMDEEERE